MQHYFDVGRRALRARGAVRSAAELAALHAALLAPLRFVWLTLSLDEIERRLAPAGTVGRQRDVRSAAKWLATGVGADVGDLVLAYDRPIRQVAEAILEWLDWP